MPRRRRYIETGAVYELCFRAKNSLPFVCYQCLHFIIQCVIGRVQRDNKVTLCHDIWNGSHAHLIVIARDSQQLVNFYAEVQKKLTDILKRLLGIKYLEVWEGNPSVILIGDLDAAKDRIAYLYSNPSKDNLEVSIDTFPGSSSWRDFLQSLERLDHQQSAQFPWIRLHKVPRASSRILSQKEDLAIIQSLIDSNSELHCVTRSPNAWMRCFGVATDEEAKRINESIISDLRNREELARRKRQAEQKTVWGTKRLSSQPILKRHTPKKRERKIFIITSLKEIRLEFLERMERFCRICRECYSQWKRGHFSVSWPLEAFQPPLPPRVNILHA